MLSRIDDRRAGIGRQRRGMPDNRNDLDGGAGEAARRGERAAAGEGCGREQNGNGKLDHDCA